MKKQKKKTATQKGVRQKMAREVVAAVGRQSVGTEELRMSRVYPRNIDIQAFETNPDYRLRTLLEGKDMVGLSQIPPRVLADVVMTMLERLQFDCQGIPALRGRSTVGDLPGFKKDPRPRVPRGVSEKYVIYHYFEPKEPNPALGKTLKQELADYRGMVIVVTQTDLFLWLPERRELVDLTIDRLDYLMNQDRWIGLHCLLQIQRFIGSQLHSLENQMRLIHGGQTNVERVLARIAVNC